MATGAADGFFRCVYDGCISGSDMGIERRPYHKNCGCALHKKSKKDNNYSNCTYKSKNVSYPLRRSWSEGSLALNLTASSTNSSPSSSLSLSSSSSSSSLVKLPIGYCNHEYED